MTRPANTGAPGIEAKRIQEMLGAIAKPHGIRLFKLHFGEDTTGDPAVWISFVLPRNYPTAPPDIRALTDLGRRVRKELLDEGLERIPYVDFQEEPTKVA
jgi:hypothetical protein